MKLNKLGLFMVGILISQLAQAKVRELYVNSNEMGTVNLKMGQSTILRFQEKPKKVVIGNQNYFNVEFVENDVTIQPLGTAKTNLFVYGEYNTYGLLLDVSNQAGYDDLVIVKRGSKPEPPPPTEKKPPDKRQNILIVERLIGKDLRMSLKKMFYHDLMKVYVIDLTFQNSKNNLVKQGDLAIKLSQANKPIEETKLIFDEAKAGVPLKARILFRIPVKKRFTLSINYQSNELKQIIEEKYL
jgi:hypothetical protein